MLATFNLGRTTSCGSARSTGAALAKPLRPPPGSWELVRHGGLGLLLCRLFSQKEKEEKLRRPHKLCVGKLVRTEWRALVCAPARRGADGGRKPLPPAAPCPPCCSSQRLCDAGGSAALLWEMRRKHSHGPVLGEERCLHGCSPSLGQPRCGAPCRKEEREEESRRQEELEPKVLRALGCDLIQENVSIRDFQRVGGTVRALGYRKRSTWSVAFWVLLKGEPWSLMGSGGERCPSRPRVLPLDTASRSLSRQAGTGSTRHCAGSGHRA